MEAITLCGAVILVFGLWMEFEPVMQRVVNTLLTSKIVTGIIPPSVEQRPTCVKYMAGI